MRDIKDNYRGNFDAVVISETERDGSTNYRIEPSKSAGLQAIGELKTRQVAGRSLVYATYGLNRAGLRAIMVAFGSVLSTTRGRLTNQDIIKGIEAELYESSSARP